MDDQKNSIHCGEQFEKGFNQKHQCDQINIQSNKGEQLEQMNDQGQQSDLEVLNLLERFEDISSDIHLIDYQQQFETCDENQLFENKFEKCHSEACILICNCINQNTKPNIKAILSKRDKFLLVSELKNDTEQYLKKYKENLIKVVSNFIKQNTPSKEQFRSINQTSVIELPQINKSGNDEEDDISDNIFNNIDMLRIKIKELNKLM